MKRLPTFCVFFALAFAASGSVRAQWVQTNGKGGNLVTSIAAMGKDVYAGTNSGVIHSTDDGKTWNTINVGLTDSNITAIIAIDSDVIAGTRQSELFHSTRNSLVWKPVGYLDYHGMIHSITKVGPLLYAGGDGVVGLSSDMGITWSRLPDSSLRDLNVNAIVQLSTVLFAATNNGVFYSLDSGTSWLRPGTKNLESTNVLTLASQGNILFAGTSNYGSQGSMGNGILRSTDAGTTWTLSLNDPSITITSLVASDSGLYAGTDRGVFLSGDSGITWTNVNAGLTDSIIHALSLNDGVIYAATEGLGIFCSTDAGKHWSANNVGIIGTSVLHIFHSGTALFAGQDREYGQYSGGVLRSTDEGENWTSVSPEADMYNISFATVNSNLVMGTQKRLYISTNDGLTWDARNGALTSSVSASVSLGRYMYAGAKGIFRSSDSGFVWNRIDSGIEKNSWVSSFGVIADTLFASTNRGIFRSIDSGIVWERINIGLTDTEISCLAILDHVVFAADVNHLGVFRSTDHGDHWHGVNSGLPNYAFSYALVKSGTNLFLGNQYGVYLTTDLGDTWSSVSDGLPYDGSERPIGSLAIDDTNLFATTHSSEGSRIWRRPLSEMIARSAVSSHPFLNSKLCCYPNPLSQSTQITFTPEAAGHAEISILNLLGTEVAHLFSGELAASEHTFTWTPNPVRRGGPDGMYECLIRMNGRVERVAMMLVR